MKEIRLEYMRPRQIVEAMKEKPIIYFPISPIEWHGVHNPIGVDGFHAYESALEVARRVGGIVMPPVFAGQGGKMKDSTLRNLGFEEPYPEVDGIDVPANILPSMYWDLDIYHLMAKEYIRQIASYGCKLIVIVVNHGALEEVAKEMDKELDNCHVIWTSCCGSGFDKYNDRGHASKGETAIVMSIRGDYVDLNELPSKEEQPYLLSREVGIYDPRFFKDEPNTDYRLHNDPRDATIEMGEEIFESGIVQVMESVNKAIAEYDI